METLTVFARCLGRFTWNMIDSHFVADWSAHSHQTNIPFSSKTTTKKRTDLIRPFLIDFSQTALHWAAKHGNDDVVKLIAGKYKADVNARTVRMSIDPSASEVINILLFSIPWFQIGAATGPATERGKLPNDSYKQLATRTATRRLPSEISSKVTTLRNVIERQQRHTAMSQRQCDYVIHQKPKSSKWKQKKNKNKGEIIGMRMILIMHI